MALAFFSERVLIDGVLVPATILIENGKISSIKEGLFAFPDTDVRNCGTDVISPGLIDSHVHINEPGRTQWEGFDTATRSAAAGGITTLVDMPLNSSPVTTTLEAFKNKINIAKDKIHVNVGFWGGIVPGNNSELAPMIEAGVLGIKAFTTHSGIDEFPNVREADLDEGMKIIAPYNVPLLVHAELDSEHAGQQGLKEAPFSYMSWLASRPKSWEDEAIKMMIKLSKSTKCRTHIVHLSSSNSISGLKNAIENGIDISVETCPQYLFFNAEEIPDNDPRYKCAPPIREKENNDKLWGAVKDGLISFIVTDHSPAPPEIKELKSGNIAKAWGGISSLELSLPAIWTKAREKGFQIQDMARLMSENVAEFLSLDKKKGKIKKGMDADIMIWDPEESFTVDQAEVHYRHKISPYHGQKLYGVIKTTILNGSVIYDNGNFLSLRQGKLIMR